MTDKASEKKTMSDKDKLAALIKLAKVNGWSLPKELDEDED